MRTRSRTTILGQWPAKSSGSISLTNYKCDGTSTVSTVTEGAQAAINNHVVSERISDYLGRGQSHGVIHRRSERLINQIVADSYPNASSPYGSFHYGVKHNDVLQYYSNATSQLQLMDVMHSSAAPANWSFSYPVVSDGSIYADLLQKARQLKADVLLNMLEANQLWPSLKSLTVSLPNLARNWKALTAKRRIATASSSFLAWKFGIGPVMRDMANIAKFAPDMLRQYNRHINQKNIRLSKLLMGNASYVRGPLNGVANGVTYATHTFQGMCLHGPEVRYVLLIKPTRSKYLTEQFAKLDFLMSRFTTSPASLLWERIPFSFVADWFVDVRGCLAKLDSLIGVEPFKVLSFTKSTRWQVQTRHYELLKRVCASGPTLFDGLVTQVDDKHYERSVLSAGFLPSWKPRYGKNQAGITAALIGQRLSRLRNVS